MRLSELAKTILQGKAQGGSKRGNQKKRWEDNILEWTGLLLADTFRLCDNRESPFVKSSVVPQRSQ